MTDTLTEPLKVGDRLRDNDPRMPDRVRVVTAIKDAWRWCGSRETVVMLAKSMDDATGQTIVNLDRIHLDDKPRRGGWSRVR